ncbi:MAG: CsgG/HfaB family protein [Candidatus Zixiibacteriota bacterium]
MGRHRQRLPWIAAIAAAALLAWMVPGRADTPELLAQGQKLYTQGKFAEAIDLLAKLAQDSTLGNAEAKSVFLLLAKATAAKGFPDQSEAYFTKVLDIDPKYQLDTKVEPPQVQRVWFKVDEARRAAGPPDPGIKTIAVLYFENNSVADRDAMAGLSKGLAAMLVTDLSRLSDLRVVERERIQYILDEIKMEQSEYFEESSAVRVGKLLGAHTLLMGSFSKLDKKKLRIDARLVKTETGELIKAEKVEGDPRKLAQLQSDLTLKIAGDLNLTVKEMQDKAIRADGGQPIEAVLAYTRGLNLEDEQKMAAAYEAYKEALAAYPNHEAARDRLVALEPLVAAGG